MHLPRMARRAPVEQLRVLNEVLARVSGPERGEHARRALEFFYRESPEEASKVNLGSYVDRLARIYLGQNGENEQIAFCHWHVPQLEDFSPLWIRQAVVSRMKAMAGRSEALLLVTGLREAVCPEGKYWTKKRERQYHQVRSWIDELACAWASRGSRLQVVVL